MGRTVQILIWIATQLIISGRVEPANNFRVASDCLLNMVIYLNQSQLRVQTLLCTIRLFMHDFHATNYNGELENLRICGFSSVTIFDHANANGLSVSNSNQLRASFFWCALCEEHASHPIVSR